MFFMLLAPLLPLRPPLQVQEKEIYILSCVWESMTQKDISGAGALGAEGAHYPNNNPKPNKVKLNEMMLSTPPRPNPRR
jgi:hypothetical protein